MDRDIAQIGKLRRKLGLTQKKLADLSGVSQSLIAKIEAGKTDPAYSKARKIFAALEQEQDRKESGKKAFHIMSRNILSVGNDELLGKAINLMKRKDVSQLPVIAGSECVGSISESTVVESIEQYGNRIASVTIEQVMDEAFPTVPVESDIEAVTGLLRFYKAVLVKRKGMIIGIITKADLLKAIEQ